MNRQKLNDKNTFILLLIINIISLISIICYFLQVSSILLFVRYIGCTLLTSVASFFCGGIIGFLFGIPKFKENEYGNYNKTIVLANSNLGQISNWLTNLIIGLGLIQLTKIPKSISIVSAFLSNAYFNGNFQPFISVILILFVIDGFLVIYLWTIFKIAPIIESRYNREENITSEAIETSPPTPPTSGINPSLRYVVFQNPNLPTDTIFQIFNTTSSNIQVKTIFKAYVDNKVINEPIDSPKYLGYEPWPLQANSMYQGHFGLEHHILKKKKLKFESFIKSELELKLEISSIALTSDGEEVRLSKVLFKYDQSRNIWLQAKKKRLTKS